MEYCVIKSNRKTLAIQINRAGEVIVRAPFYVSAEDIRQVVESRQNWIRKKQLGFQNRDSSGILYTEEELKQLEKTAREKIIPRVEFYAPQVGVTYGRITIRHQKTRWGSCSQKGNLNFNCLLALMPDQVLDSVVVHELCHRKEMNHSRRFYDEVYKVFPEYDYWNRWLKQHGKEYIFRLR